MKVTPPGYIGRIMFGAAFVVWGLVAFAPKFLISLHPNTPFAIDILAPFILFGIVLLAIGGILWRGGLD